MGVIYIVHMLQAFLKLHDFEKKTNFLDTGEEQIKTSYFYKQIGFYC